MNLIPSDFSNDLSQGSSGGQFGEQILPWGSLCECTPLSNVVGN